MSFYATFDGMITVLHSVDKDTIIQKIQDAFDTHEVIINGETENSYDLWFGEYASYQEDAIYAFLAEIEPNTISGEIVYTGEDASNWRHVFDGTSHEWIEQEGYIAYKEEGTTIKQRMTYLEELTKQTNELFSRDSDEPER